MITGTKLKAIRAIKGITQAQLAAQAGVSATAIAEFETGKRDIRASTIAKLCASMEIGVTYKVNTTLISGP